MTTSLDSKPKLGMNVGLMNADVETRLLQIIDRTLARDGVDVHDPLPHAPVRSVADGVAPITGNVLIPLGRVISTLGANLRLLKPGL